MTVPRDQLRLTPGELDSLLTSARTLRIGTVSPDGWPHVVPLWFVWHDGAIFVNNLRRSRRSSDLASGSRVALCIDVGEVYQELRGAVLYGRFEEASGPEGSGTTLDTVRAEFARKYWGGAHVPELKSHVWLRCKPERLVSWDFRKIPQGRDRRLEAVREPER